MRLGGDIMGQVNNSNNITINDLIINNVYTNQDIVTAFKCSPQGGMRRAKLTKSLVLFVLHHGSIYEDKWEGDVLKYTGMGRTKNQKLKSQNKTLFESRTNKKLKVYLFESFVKKEYIYRGEVRLIDDPDYVDELDVNGENRKVYKFPLELVDKTPLVIQNNTINTHNEEKKKKLKNYDYDKLREAAKKSGTKKPRKINTTSNTTDRDEAVRDFTLVRANGICDLCDHPAPFIDKDGVPYLECHHVKTLADGGPDAIYNTVALCPNCHRRMHKLKDSKDKTKLKKKIKYYLERDNETELLIEFKKLFGK